MAATTRISRPELTLPEAEAALVQACYQDASVILEYGSGGSTVMAAEMPGKQVFSVESDRHWAKMMRNWLTENAPADGTQVDVIWADIGPTKKWGHPQDHSEWQRYARYPLEVWDLDDFRQPDVVLVDGRFRPGCALAAAFRSLKPVTVLVDDYANRKHYHKVERYLGTPQITGRMGRFEVTPMPVPADKLLDIIRMMTQP
ncbi:MAG: hypothetical protein AB8B82_02450 [Roseovarius sp.]